jgi:hypothetical protein
MSLETVVMFPRRAASAHHLDAVARRVRELDPSKMKPWTKSSRKQPPGVPRRRRSRTSPRAAHRPIGSTRRSGAAVEVRDQAAGAAVGSGGEIEAHARASRAIAAAVVFSAVLRDAPVLLSLPVGET